MNPEDNNPTQPPQDEPTGAGPTDSTNTEFKQGKGHVEANKKNNATGVEQPVKNEAYHVPETPGAYTQPTANVGFQLSHTKNLGNYENLKVSVDVHIPCYVTELDSVFTYAKEWTEARFEEVMAEVNETTGGGDG